MSKASPREMTSAYELCEGEARAAIVGHTMRRLLLPSAILLLLTAAYVHTPHGQIRSVRQIAPGVVHRFGDRDVRQPANTSWIEFRDFVVVIEANTPWGIRDILPEIQKTTSKSIRYVFDTHYHWDHTHAVRFDDLAHRGHAEVLCERQEYRDHRGWL